MEVTKKSVYYVFLFVLVLAMLIFGDLEDLVGMAAFFGVLFLFLGIIFISVGFFSAKNNLFQHKGFNSYFKFLFYAGVFAIPAIFLSKFLGQQTLDLTSSTGNVVTQTIFSPKLLSAVLVFFVAFVMLYFVLFALNDK